MTRADVERAVKDDATFSSRHVMETGSPYGVITIPPAQVLSTPIEMNPPAHSRRPPRPGVTPTASVSPSTPPLSRWAARAIPSRTSAGPSPRPQATTWAT
jgi:hypothetical protein